MTWVLVTQIDIIEQNLSSETFGMKLIQLGVFYFACMFVWVTFEVIVGGAINMIKKSISEASRVSKK
jgi:hypothetical protein